MPLTLCSINHVLVDEEVVSRLCYLCSRGQVRGRRFSTSITASAWMTYLQSVDTELSLSVLLETDSKAGHPAIMYPSDLARGLRQEECPRKGDHPSLRLSQWLDHVLWQERRLGRLLVANRGRTGARSRSPVLERSCCPHDA